LPLGRLVYGRIIKIEEKGETKRFHCSLRKSVVVYGINAMQRDDIEVGKQLEAIIITVLEGKAYGQIKGSYNKIKVKEGKGIKEGDIVIVTVKKVNK
jgi:hypothetical protein